MVAAVWVASAAGLVAQGPAENPAQACAAKNQIDAATVGQYKFAAYKSNDGACLQVTSGGKVVYSQSVDSFQTYTLGQKEDAQDNIGAIANGTDVTGRGQPDMIVSLFTGGAHCCSIHYVFELGPQFKLLATLNDSDDDMAHFERLADGHYYYMTADWTFGYWPTCFACSPSALVTLRWAVDAKGGGFHLATDKMQTAAPKTADWNKELSAAQKVVAAGDADSIGTTMWQTVLNLDLWRAIGSGVEVCGCAGAQGAAEAVADARGLLLGAEDEPVLAGFAADVEGCAGGVRECGGKAGQLGTDPPHCLFS